MAKHGANGLDLPKEPNAVRRHAENNQATKSATTPPATGPNPTPLLLSCAMFTSLTGHAPTTSRPVPANRGRPAHARL